MGASQTQWRLHCFVSRQKILKHESQAGNFFPWQSSLHEHNEPTIQEKSLYHPLTYGGGLHNPQTMKRSISPPELFKTGQITP